MLLRVSYFSGYSFMKMNESGGLSESVPLSHSLGGGTPGHYGKGGTLCGTASGTPDLKALAIAKLCGTVSGTICGTYKKTLSRCPVSGGTKSGTEFERNRQVSAGQNPAPSPAEVPPPAPPLACFACSCWQKVPGLAWWCGRCAVTGRKINMQSRCDLGLEEWQQSPLQERTAPQPGERRANRY